MRCSAGERVDPRRVAEVEERVPGRVRVVEHAVEDLDLGDRAAGVVAQPAELVDQRRSGCSSGTQP